MRLKAETITDPLTRESRLRMARDWDRLANAISPKKAN
jgi:hypothetical protein